MRPLCRWLLVVGVVLRLAAPAWHDHPRGDVVLDTGVVASLSSGHGFASGFERGTLLVRGPGSPGPGDRADQHGPLWPLIAAPFARIAGSAFGGLQLASLLFGLVLLAQVWRLVDRLTEGIVGAPDGLPVLAAALVGLSFLALDFSANGSLYAAQACGVLLLVELLASRRARPVASGVVLGLLLLLNHQCLVLLPLPPLALALGARRGARGRGLLAGLGVVAMALAVQVPWWWRNALVFGDPFHSVNGLYLLHRLGVEPQLLLEDGRPVARWLGSVSASAAFGALKSQVLPNLLYLFVTGLLVVPVLLGPLAVTAWTDLRRAVASADRRRLAAWSAATVLAAVAVAWPATKLRYLVALIPLGTALGVAALARPPSRAHGRAALAVTALWIALLVATLDDVMGSSVHARPVRWVTLLAVGAVSLALPLWIRQRCARTPAAASRLPVALAAVPRLPVGLAGLPIAALLLAAALVPAPHTAYHSTSWMPDFFGNDAEAREAAQAEGLARARRAMVASPAGAGGAADAGAFAGTGASAGSDASADTGDTTAGAARPTVIGPVGLLAWRDLRLITLPLGPGTAAGEAALGALLDAPPGGGRVDHVVTILGDGWLGSRDAAQADADDAGDANDAADATGDPAHTAVASTPIAPGAPWLGGRLVVEQGPDAGGVILSRVVR